MTIKKTIKKLIKKATPKKESKIGKEDTAKLSAEFKAKKERIARERALQKKFIGKKIDKSRVIVKLFLKDINGREMMDVRLDDKTSMTVLLEELEKMAK